MAREGIGCINDTGSKKEDRVDQATESSVGGSRKCFQSQKHGHYME